MEIIKKGEYKIHTEYRLEFDFGDGAGFSFPCDKFGNPLPFEYEDAKANYEECIAHPERFCRPAYVNELQWGWREPSVGRCSCGEEVTLTNDYEGATQCPKCGQWYNLFGQALIDPEYWEDDFSDY